MPSRSTRIPASPPIVLPLALAFAALFSPRLSAADLVRSAPELSRGTIQTADGATATYIRVQAPPPPPPVAPPLSQSRYLPTAQELLTEAKPVETLSLTAIVYPARAGLPVLSELRWSHRGRDWRAFSSVNFFHLTQFSQIETASTVYTWFPFVSQATADDPARPDGLSFSPGQAEFFVDAPEADIAAHPEAFDALLWLHELYGREGARLAADHARRETESAARERLALARAKEKRPVIIRYWAPAQPSSAQP